MKKIIILMLTISFFKFGNAQILKKEIPDKLVVLTFDDGCASHHSIVAPLLKKYKFNATFFMCEFPPNYKDSTKYMTWEQVKKLSEMGFEVANHTLSHKHINRLSKSHAIEEIRAIEAKCDSVGISKPASFAYPAYDLNAQSLEILRELNYKYARAGGKRPYNPLEDHPYLIPSWAMKTDNIELIRTAFSEAKNGNIVVITVHGVPDIEHPWVDTSPEVFKSHLEFLSRNNYKVISISDLDDYIDVDEALKTIIPDLDKPLKN
ncbi:polysaccharide deacetylase family protein [Flavobacteriaceae bacterium SZ-1-7]|uniref:polysaccharide deacetylase family protein n=1 Tax=Tamlana sedimenti TaxID=3134126 RepID=UPI003127900C